MADLAADSDVDRVNSRSDRQWSLGSQVTQGINEKQEAGAARVHNPRLLECRKLLGRVRQCHLGGRPCGLGGCGEVAAGLDRLQRSNGRCPSHAQDRALDGSDHGLAGEVISVGQCRSQHR